MKLLKYQRDPLDPADWPKYRWNGKPLREWRAFNKISLVTFALQVGSTKSYLSRMERNQGDINPPAALVYTIVRRTGLIDELFERIDP